MTEVIVPPLLNLSISFPLFHLIVETTLILQEHSQLSNGLLGLKYQGHKLLITMEISIEKYQRIKIQMWKFEVNLKLT